MSPLRAGEAAAMGKRVWKVEWVARPKSDGSQRLSQAVKLVIDHAVDVRAARPPSKARARGWQVLGRGFRDLLILELGWQARGGSAGCDQ
jgi:hypothetical protein